MQKQMSTRRKSCVACVKAKRRCDLQSPYCARCSTRGLICNYPRSNPDSMEGPPSFNMSFEYAPYTNIPTLHPMYQFDDLLNPTLIPSKHVYISDQRLDSCVQHIHDYLTKIVQYGRTPFLNPLLYDDALPLCLQDVYCVCAAYRSKTATNETLIFRILSSKAGELVSKRGYCSFQDELASVQALILYQIIRLFDGDIRQRGIAEVHAQVLEAWAIRLRQRSELDLPLSIQTSPYRKWLFIESVRRTILMSIFVRAIYDAIKTGFCEKVPEMASLPLTVQGDLWEADSEGEWMRATRGSQPDVLAYHEFVERWNGGPVDGDVEDFQKVLLIACIGEEGIHTRFLESVTRGVEWT